MIKPWKHGKVVGLLQRKQSIYEDVSFEYVSNGTFYDFLQCMWIPILPYFVFSSNFSGKANIVASQSTADQQGCDSRGHGGWKSLLGFLQEL